MTTDEHIAALRLKECDLWKQLQAASDVERESRNAWVAAKAAYDEALDERRIELEVQKRLLERGVNQAA